MIKKIYVTYQKLGIKYLISYGIKSTPLYVLSGFIMRLIYKLVLKTSPTEKNFNNNQSIGILGRGPSLNRVKELNFLDNIIIINNFNKECKIEGVNEIMEEKNIIHFLNSGEPVLTPGKILKYNVNKYQLSRMRMDGSNNWWREERTHHGPEAIGFKPNYLPGEIEPYLQRESYPDFVSAYDGNFPANCGMLAIIYAAHHLNCEEIYCAGIDFYEDERYARSNEKITWESDEKFDQETSKLHTEMEGIASRFPNTEFHFLTHSKFDPDQPNIQIHNDILTE